MPRSSAPPIPRIELAYAPTPLLKLERLSAELGVELWVKRDDLTGLLESGNKIRKLEFLFGEALAQNADTIITCGTPQSTACRAVAAVAARLGLRAVLALEGPQPAEYDGDLLLTKLLGAHVRYCTGAEWARVGELMQDLAAEARANGRTPYVIPENGAGVAGALGYLACGQEIAQQVRHGAPDFDTIAIVAFSGGSQAGMLMGRQLTGLRADVVSIPVAQPGPIVQDYVMGLIDEARHRYGLEVTAPDQVRVLDGYQGEDATARAAALDTVVRLARLEGVVLDPASTAKAFYGLLDHVRRQPGDLGRRICFVHTGGVFNIFPFRRELGGLIDATPLG